MRQDTRRVALSFIIFLSATLVAPSSWDHAQTHSRIVRVEGLIELDHSDGFDFTKLSVGLLYREGPNQRWNSTGVAPPDKLGRFSREVPSDSEVVLQIDSTDPTIRQSDTHLDESDFYTWNKQKREWTNVYRTQFRLSSQSLATIERKVELERGAAISFRAPVSRTTGTLRMIDRCKVTSNSKQGNNVVFFYEPPNGTVIGGLRPGCWIVVYTDDSDKVLLQKQVYLEAGQVASLE